MTYSEKLRDPRWQKKRLEILQRDNWRCQTILCFGKPTATLHVHHLDYEYGRVPWDYPDDNFLTLCETCHEEVTESRKINEAKIISNFRSKLQDSFYQYCAGQIFEANALCEIVQLVREYLHIHGEDKLINLLARECEKRERKKQKSNAENPHN